MAFQRKVAVTWADIKKGDRILLPDVNSIVGHSVWDVLKAKADGKKMRVTVARGGKEFSGKMPAKGQVERYEAIKGKAWDKADDAAEEAVKEILGAELLGIKPGPGEAYIVPLVDVSTIAAHLLTFHGITDALAGRESGAWERMVKLHDTDHERPINELHVPHRHDKKRPVVDVGPKFQ